MATKQRQQYRVGKKQGRAILEVETGKEHLLFPVGQEAAAAEYCEYLNNIKDESNKYLAKLIQKSMSFGLFWGLLAGIGIYYAFLHLLK